MQQEDRRTLSREYFSKERLAEHHYRSFNAFLNRGMQEVVTEKGIIDTDIGDKEGEEPVFVELGDIRVVTPRVREADGSEELLYPQEARLRNITYAAPVFMEMTIVKGEGDDKRVVDSTETKVGRMPIMVGSEKCNIANFDKEDLVEIGEDPADPGGYFIVNGSERVLMTSEDLAPNKILAEYDTKYGDEIQVAKTFSQRRGYRALVLVERSRDGLLEVSFPSVSGRVNFVTLVRALGLESDEEIVHRVSDDPEIVKFMLENLEAAEVQTQEEAIETLGKRVASGQGKNYQLKRANYVIDRYLLPHLHEDGVEEEEVRINKAYYLARMAEACFELALGRRDSDDKDHYANKRLKVSGDLMKDLFRTALNKLARDVKYQLERANMRNRQLSVNTVVRSDVLTERLEHPIATGNWVGGRSGVSQLVDRTDFMGVLSHLRRLRSPLSRSQPHFEARDLHATQWGRICPSETPEGPNCGLVKNFAQAMELSQNIEDEQELKQELSSMGVEGIPGIESIEGSAD
ncbi:DNA-directed RNA polymerase subunit beta'' [Haladaptatus paucihalophilus DX253]|uniref:DNA-directed RNA polymerase n=1 Tax=Haladaptatus paucihalophilus DX253 TaxID=797209 RepID=E7QTR0_HALPU|nr:MULTISPECIES: DNA-directed RNA polymerase subunit B'' [Haladaptatus]EFW91989.1 DNA-directed RNA polymerase subunit beta'' [Haladaptatus paucihalophilus DX253]ODR83516.1 DNA-directed RNA polymerase subunit B'' [Haladaptatus sp. W1]GKZ14144.1 DNA-directed RNA polymerase subunit B'' [Haladaptatus sp. T7]SHK85003.1 DNA-directed RNA polymerase, subunit B [Haladaptatus paucihalophilus DX253]